MVAFGFLPQQFGRWWVPTNGTLPFYECRLSGRDTLTLPYQKEFELFALTSGRDAKNFERECLCHHSRPNHLLKRSLFLFFVASVSRDGTLKLWELNDDGNMRKTLQGTSKWIYSCEWSPDAKMMVTTGDSRSVRFSFYTFDNILKNISCVSIIFMSICLRLNLEHFMFVCMF